MFIVFRHALPLFTSLLNLVAAYDPVGYGVPYNHLMFADNREGLVEISLQVLCVTLENEAGCNQNVSVDGTSGGTAMEQTSDVIIIICPFLLLVVAYGAIDFQTDTSMLWDLT